MVEIKVLDFQILCAWLKLVPCQRRPWHTSQVLVSGSDCSCVNDASPKRYHFLRCCEQTSHTRSVTVIDVREIFLFYMNKKLCCSNRPFFCKRSGTEELPYITEVFYSRVVSTTVCSTMCRP